MVEEWSIIKDAPDYMVSNLGRVKSCPRKIWNGWNYFLSKEKMLKPNRVTKGYLQVSLRVGKKRRMFVVHRLVAQSFVLNPEPTKYKQVNHIDGNKENNVVSNLEWCDNSLNQIHAWRLGLNKGNKGKSHRGKRTYIILQDGTKRTFDSVAELSRFIIGKCDSNICKCIKNRGQYKGLKIGYA